MVILVINHINSEGDIDS